MAMAMIWGATFFSIKALVETIPVPDLLAVRFLIALAVIGTLAWRQWRMTRETLRRGLGLGVLFTGAQLLQTFGLAHTAASVSGFITGLYVVFTPFLAAALLRERLSRFTWLAVVLATLGLSVLTLDLTTGFTIGVGELLTLASAFVYALHIVALDHWSTSATSLSLTNVQTSVMAVTCLVLALPGGIVLPQGPTQWAWMLYLAVLAGSLVLFLQIWAQSQVESTTAAVIMAGEPVWAAFFAVSFGGESVRWQMLVGGLTMVAAMLLVVLAPQLRRRRRPV